MESKRDWTVRLSIGKHDVPPALPPPRPPLLPHPVPGRHGPALQGRLCHLGRDELGPCHHLLRVGEGERILEPALWSEGGLGRVREGGEGGGEGWSVGMGLVKVHEQIGTESSRRDLIEFGTRKLALSLF